MAENNIQSDDFISIGNIKTAILDFFSFIFRVFDYITSAIQLKKAMVLICCFIGLAIGYLYYLLTPPYYQAEMIVYQNDLTKKAYNEIISNLNNLLITQSYRTFATELKLDTNLANKVSSIEAVSINNESLINDTTTRTGQPFKVKVKINDNSVTAPLQNALLNYLNNNQYLKQIKDGQKRIYEQKLEFINNEQRRLDSLKETYNRALASMKMPNTFYNNALNPADLYRQSSDLDSQKDAILRWLNNESKSVLLIDGFKKSARPQSLSLKEPLFIGLAAGALLGVFLALLAALKRSIPLNN